ncbi:hypothetical protein [Modestobacter sp. NPDC049651]|uniref:hypothetical protein n=1 Tax=unclassified Modestobacter TaxID=2643866 RepID=UPI0033E8D9AB
MSEGRFGAPAGLLQRLVRTEVRVGDVRDAVEQLGPVPAGLQLGLEDAGRGPLLVLEEGGRSTRVLLAELALEMTRAHVAATPDAVTAALTSWLAHRPVPDAAAAEAGIAVLDWADRRHTELGWQVVVVRDGLTVPWRPTAAATTALVHRTRSAALGRSFTVPGRLRVTGPVGVWTHPDTPGLDTAVLVRPEELLREMAGAGLRLRDVHVVVTPRRPVACADAGVARRLAAEGTEPCRTLPWTALPDLGWV